MENEIGRIDEDAICEIVYRERNRPIQIWRQTPRTSRPYPSHWHEELEINAVFFGDVEYCVGGRQVCVDGEGFCLINSREVHSARRIQFPQDTKQREDLIGITILVSHEFMESLLPDYRHMFFRIDREEDRQDIFARFLKMREVCMEGPKELSQEFRNVGLVCEILSILCSRCSHPLEDININHQKNDERIRIILEYIHTHSDEPLQQQKLADKFYFSRGYFASFFKKYTGKTFKQYLVDLRLQKAEKLLRETGQSVSQIAQDTGFSDERRFIENFKQQFGVTPGMFRRQMKQQEEPAS